MANSARIDELRKKFDENPRRYFAPLANEYRKLGDLDQAIFICQEYLPQQPGHMSGHIVYGQALYEAGRMDEARGVFETALTLDPENLIALRHLGDIAKATNDATGARSWYLRVLEVDPRNEEIAALLASLGTAVAEPVAVEDAAPSASPVEDLAESLRMDDQQPPEIAAADELLELPSSDTPFGGVEAIDDTATELPPPIPPTASFASDDTELLDIGDMPGPRDEAGEHVPSWASTERRDDTPPELPPSVESATEPEPLEISPTFAEQAASPDDMTFEPLAIEGLESERAVSSNTADGPSTSADEIESAVPGLELSSHSWPPPPAVESRGDDDALGEFTLPASVPSSVVEEASTVDDSAPQMDEAENFEFASEAHTPSEPVAATADAAPEFEPPPLPAAEIEFESDVATAAASAQEPEPESAPAAEMESEPEAEPAVVMADASDVEAPAAEADSWTPPESQAPPERRDMATPSAPATLFVTETMAELYLKQGHLESALDIYTHLIEQRPDDEGLAARRQVIADQLYGKPEPIDAPFAAPAQSGPTIREFLAELLARIARVASVEEPADVEPVAMESEPAAPVEEPVNAPAPERPAPRPTPTSASDTVSGSIDSLFGGVNAAEADVAAAVALSDAFAAEAPETPLLAGMPAHRAANELSLDHVFRAGTPQPEPENGSNFSFDQFFAEEIAESRPAGGGDAATNPGASPDDIAQFNAWLSGLKKT